MPHSVKLNDHKLLKWDLNRDLTAVTSVRVVMAKLVGGPLVLDRAGTIADAANGIVSLQLSATDYGAGKLELPTGVNRDVFKVEVITDGQLTHPDESDNPYEVLTLVRDLG